MIKYGMLFHFLQVQRNKMINPRTSEQQNQRERENPNDIIVFYSIIPYLDLAHNLAFYCTILVYFWLRIFTLVSFPYT